MKICKDFESWIGIYEVFCFSLFAPHMFENLVCPVGPQDKNKVYTEDSAELYENIKLPVSTSHDDPYGGESCKCDCHSTVTDLKPKTPSEHCASCGTKVF